MIQWLNCILKGGGMVGKVVGESQKIRCPIPTKNSSVTIKEAIVAQLNLIRVQNVGKNVTIFGIFVGNMELDKLELSFVGTTFLNFIPDYLDRDVMEIIFFIQEPTT